MIKTISIVAALAFTSSSVLAASSVAQLTGSNGKVLINMGSGFAAPEGIVDLKAGDKVFVGKDSSAVISYSNGCAVSVDAGSVVSVAAKAPCKKGDVAAVESTLITPVADMEEPSAAPFLGAGLLPLLLIGGTVAAVGTVLVLTNDDTAAAATPVGD